MSSLRFVLGLDEAGRGPVLGPMVMAGVLLRPARAAALTRAGVADSKAYGAGALAHERRQALALRVRELAEVVVVRVVDPATIDLRVAGEKLNLLERELASDIIGECPPAHRIIADGARMFSPLCARFPALECHDRAESVHVAVAAASIVAKVHRDELFRCIARRYEPDFGPLHGGGYQNAATNHFLERFFARHARLPPEARHTWGGASQRRAARRP